MKNLAADLIEMDQTETQLRHSMLKAPQYFAADLTRLEALHARYAADLLSDCQKNGWPTIAAVGWESAHAAARLSRNCFSQPTFLHACLSIVEQACRFGEIGGNWFAELYDTIMFFENKPQVFGTFITWNEKLDAAPWIMIDAATVDQRREAFTLDPLATALPMALEKFRETNEAPPDYKSYRTDFEKWARASGWVRA